MTDFVSSYRTSIIQLKIKELFSIVKKCGEQNNTIRSLAISSETGL